MLSIIIIGSCTLFFVSVVLMTIKGLQSAHLYTVYCCHINPCFIYNEDYILAILAQLVTNSLHWKYSLAT